MWRSWRWAGREENVRRVNKVVSLIFANRKRGGEWADVSWLDHEKSDNLLRHWGTFSERKTVTSTTWTDILSYYHTCCCFSIFQMLISHIIQGCQDPVLKGRTTFTQVRTCIRGRTEVPAGFCPPRTVSGQPLTWIVAFSVRPSMQQSLNVRIRTWVKETFWAHKRSNECSRTIFMVFSLSIPSGFHCGTGTAAGWMCGRRVTTPFSKRFVCFMLENSCTKNNLPIQT